MKLENFEQDFGEEIGRIKKAQFSLVAVPHFGIPSYQVFNRRALSFAFAIPALMMMFGFFVVNKQPDTLYNNQIAMLEDSNTRLINQLDNLDNAN